MKKAFSLAAAALVAVAAFSQPKSDLRPDKTVLLYAESADSLADPVLGRSVEYAGYTIEEDNGLRGPETVTAKGGIGNISEYARMDLYFPEKPNGLMVVVCPGGGYRYVATYNEGLYVAEWMREHGVTTCVVKYRMPNLHYTIPLADVQNAFRYCRDNADAWGVSKIGVMGFSAGGHLAASAETMYVDEQTRPDFAVLIYPVISLDRPESSTRKQLAGQEGETDPDIQAAVIERFSTEKRVTVSTPPTFLALCSDDKSVPASNGIRFFEALAACGVQREMYIYPTGGHGWGFTTGRFGRDKIGYCREEFFTALARFLDNQK